MVPKGKVAFPRWSGCIFAKDRFVHTTRSRGGSMKSHKLLLTLIGGWILFIGLDSTNGHMSALAVRSLHKPVQVAFLITKFLRTIVLFILAASTFLLIAQPNKKE